MDILTTTDYTKILTYNDLLFANLGYIIGAGIFVLIGKTVNIAGSFAWISVILSGLVIYFISKAYITVYNKYKTNDAEFMAITDKYGFLIGQVSTVIMLVSLLFIIFVVLIGFGEYSSAFINNLVSARVLSVIGLISAILVNIIGIGITVQLNKIITISGIIGLGILIVLGAIYIFTTTRSFTLSSVVPTYKKISYKNLFSIVLKIVFGAFIFIFAYTGFEMILRLSKESKTQIHIPEAIRDSIWITIIIYTLICVVIIYTIGEHTHTNKPLSNAIKILTTNKFIIKYIEYCGVGLTWTTVLLSITYASRLFNEFLIKLNIYIDTPTPIDTSPTSSNTIPQLTTQLTFSNTISQPTTQLTSSNTTQPTTQLTSSNATIFTLLLQNLSQINTITHTPIYNIVFIGIILLLLSILNLDILSSTIIANSGLVFIKFMVVLSS